MYIVILPLKTRQPATKKAKRKDARHQLQDKGLDVIAETMVWINQLVEEIIEPYSDVKN
ncbi:hypothetical protein N9M78_04695 [Alphaproteobacteria bacterium]|nr:hypothetical protein [Alphaproteobacteria bacterium]